MISSWLVSADSAVLVAILQSALIEDSESKP